MATHNSTGSHRANKPQRLAVHSPTVKPDETRIGEGVKGVTLSEEQLERVTRALGDINTSFVSMRRLIIDSVDSADDGEACAFAIEQIAKTGCRRADLIARLLGDPGFGNFEDEFEMPRRGGDHV